MNSHEQMDSMPDLPAMDSPAIESVAKRAWHRPVVSFVPIQVTANTPKTGSIPDGASSTA